MQTQDNSEKCYRRGNRRTQRKTSSRPSKLKLFHQRIKFEYTNIKRPFKPSLPHVLEPSKLLLPTDFSESCLLQLFESRNMPDYIRQASPASFGKSPKLSNLQNTLYTLNRYELCLDTNLLSMGITIEEGRRRDYKDFSLRMSSSLSNEVRVL